MYIINGTNHPLNFYKKEDIDTGRPGKYNIPKPGHKPYKRIPKGIVKNSTYVPGTEWKVTTEGVEFTSSRAYSCMPAPFEIPIEKVNLDTVFVVSRLYAADLIARVNLGYFVPYFHRMYVPGEPVYGRKNGKNEGYEVIGCLNLQKVANFILPSYYAQHFYNAQMGADAMSLQNAVNYWMAQPNYQMLQTMDLQQGTQEIGALNYLISEMNRVGITL